MRPEAPTVYTKTYRYLHLKKKNLHKEDTSHYREHIYYLEICWYLWNHSGQCLDVHCPEISSLLMTVLGHSSLLA